MNLYQAIGSDLNSRGGYLKCEKCGRTRNLGDTAGYLRNGWPECHGFTMTWITQKQIDEKVTT